MARHLACQIPLIAHWCCVYVDQANHVTGAYYNLKGVMRSEEVSLFCVHDFFV